MHHTAVQNSNGIWIIFAVGAVVCLYWLRGLRLAREGARLVLGNACLALLVFFICKGLLLRSLVPETNASLWAGMAGLVLFIQRSNGIRRSRHIPASVRRRVIARDLKGDPYDSKKHHIDHVWPHSKGGSNTADNLRVIEKKRNLKKGAQRPKLTEMW